MIITRLMGGLGNQIFQYAVGRALSAAQNEELRLDVSYFDKNRLRSFALDKLSINAKKAKQSEIRPFFEPPPEKKAARWLHRWFIRRNREYHYLPEKGFPYDESVFRTSGNRYLDGYWQSPNYFSAIRPMLLRELQPRIRFSKECLKFSAETKSCESVFVHVRRGDYVNNPKTNAYHGTLSAAYYETAVKRVGEAVGSPVFYVFSDDRAWVKEHLRLPPDSVFVSLEGENADIEEMYLMGQCRHAVVANSSFSWWGAWSITNPQALVVCPGQWFKNTGLDTRDLRPESWVRIDCPLE